MAEEGEKVELYVYDISGGMAQTFGSMLLGAPMEAVYHTSVVVGGTEYFFGGGVQRCVAGQTPFGAPMRKEVIGHTQLPKEVREEMLADISRQFTPQSYNLITNNCNHFTSAWAELLTGSPIAEKYTGQAQSVLQSPIGQMLLPVMARMEEQLGGATATGFPGAPQAGPGR